MAFLGAMLSSIGKGGSLLGGIGDALQKRQEQKFEDGEAASGKSGVGGTLKSMATMMPDRPAQDFTGGYQPQVQPFQYHPSPAPSMAPAPTYPPPAAAGPAPIAPMAPAAAPAAPPAAPPQPQSRGQKVLGTFENLMQSRPGGPLYY
jgi:septal ring-binding cell division protein DamX